MRGFRSLMLAASLALGLVGLGAGVAQAQYIEKPGYVDPAGYGYGYGGGYRYAPPPAYYAPPRPIFVPPPVYFAPPPVRYIPPPVYYAPRPYYGRPHHGHRRHW